MKKHEMTLAEYMEAYRIKFEEIHKRKMVIQDEMWVIQDHELAVKKHKEATALTPSLK